MTRACQSRLRQRPALAKLMTVIQLGRQGSLWQRVALASVAALGVALGACGGADSKPAPAASPGSPVATTEPAAASAIAAENQQPGATDWQISDPALGGEIAGYAGATSYDRGETVDLHVSTRADGERYSIALYRMGWYGGAGARLMKTMDSLTGRPQGYWTPAEGLRACPSCQFDRAAGLLDARWETSYRLKLDRSWPSGVYMARLQDAEGKQAFVPIIVRDDGRRADLLVQLSTNTWQAYNAWGDHSLYGSFDEARNWVGKQGRAYKVSYNRPYDPTENDVTEYGAGEFFRFEYNFVRWAEAQGYEMTYATDVDVHARNDALAHRHGFVSLGHDEYWSWQQRDQVERSRDAGVGLAFFGGNDVYWQVRFEPDADGAKDRTLVCYKDAALDPMATKDPKRTTVLWAADPVDRPQGTLTGTTYGSNATPPEQSWVVADAGSWVFNGSGLAQGDEVPGILGYEYDKPADESQRPPGLDVVALSPVEGFNGAEQSASTVYTGPAGAPVFNAGTIQWSWALDDFGHEEIGRFADRRLQIVTTNVLNALIYAPE
jgi:hypothetical protein